MKLHFAFLFLLIASVSRAVDPTSGFSARFEQIKNTATAEQLYRFLFDLPKGGDLHNHQDGSNWPDWWFQVATDPARNHGEIFYTRTKILRSSKTVAPIYFITIPKWRYDRLPEADQAEYERLDALPEATRQQWLAALWLGEPKDGRDKFFEQIWPRIGGILQDPYVSAEALVISLQHFGAEHVRYVETQNLIFGLGSEYYHDQTGQVLTLDQVAAIYRDRLRQPDVQATGLTVRFQAVVLRFSPLAEAGVEAAYDFVDRHRDLWVGINMAGREDNEKGYPARFLDVYRKMAGKYPRISLSIHAGESDEPNRHIRDTLLLGATRIGHGVNLLTDPDTMLTVKNSQVLVEINLISNKILEYVKDFADHPFPRLLRFGILTCLNTDDRGMWGSDFTDEYYIAVKNYHLSWEELVSLGRNSLNASFAQAETKQQLLDSYDRALAEFVARYSGDWPAAVQQVPATGSPYAARELGIQLPIR